MLGWSPGTCCRPGTVFAFLAEHRSRLFPDELFADLFPSGRGRPSIPGEVVASVIVLQALHGLTDRGLNPGKQRADAAIADTLGSSRARLTARPRRD